MTLQAAERAAVDAGEQARFGLTVSRKVGNAVERNRVKRRLRAALRALAAASPGKAGAPLGKPRFDYVVVARREAMAAPFESLLDDLRHGVAGVHAPRGARPSGNRSGPPGSARRPEPADSPDRSPESH
jgi:ribonuclease P protein component